MSTNDGGPAFPCPGYDGGTDIEECRTFPASGMSLRDWFAGMAMQAMLIRSKDRALCWPESAEDAYTVADAMIAQREEKP